MGKVRTIERIVRAQEAMEGAGVRIRRSIGLPSYDKLDPFLLLDEFKSDDSSDYIAGFPDHPHRGFETVTYMLAGRMRHEDHAGNRGELEPGAVQWMTAGRGIIHSEMPLQENGLMWGFQLWVNLPSHAKMQPPRYQDIPADEIPQWELESGVHVRLIAGTLGDESGPVIGIVSQPLYADLLLEPQTAWTSTVPEGHNVFVYVYDGALSIGDEHAASGELSVFHRDGDSLQVRAEDQGARFLLVAAQPLNEPVVRYGPFVMNTREEIQQAFEDYRNGRLMGTS